MMEWIVSSSALILIILALRQCLKGRITLRLQYALWGLALLRLLIPVSLFSSSLSILNLAQQVTQQPQVQTVIQTAQEPIRFESEGYAVDEETGSREPVTNTYMVAPSHSLNEPYTPEDVVLGIWIMGVVLSFGFMAVCNLRFGSKVRRDRKQLDVTWTSLPVYVTSQVETPCLFGLFRPSIYLTPEAVSDEKKLRHVIEHELTHYRHGDYIAAPLRCIALALHWYNPLVWLAAKISRQDGELACDEGTIARLGEQERAEYGRTLIQLTCERARLSDIMLTATTMTGSAKNLKERIVLIAKKPKMAVYTLIAVILIAVIAVGCTFTGARDRPSEDVLEQIRAEGQKYLDHVTILGQDVDSGVVSPEAGIFLPEDMIMDCFSAVITGQYKDASKTLGSERVELVPGEWKIIDDLDQYESLRLILDYTVDGEVLAVREIDLLHFDTTEENISMSRSVLNQVSDYAGVYFSEQMAALNGAFNLSDIHYDSITHFEPEQIVVSLAVKQDLYLYYVSGHFNRTDGEKLDTAVYILMRYDDGWHYVTAIEPEKVDSEFSTTEMLEKYPTKYDAAAIETYFENRDDMVYFSESVRVTIHYEDNVEEIASQLPDDAVNRVILESMENEYPGRSSVVNVDEIHEIVVVPLNEAGRTMEVWKLKFSPVLDDDEVGPALERYLVIIDAPEISSRWKLTDYNCSEIDTQISSELVEQTGSESGAVGFVVRQMLELQAGDLEQFQEKYQSVQAQLSSGTQPIGTMPVYDPDNMQFEENRNYLTNGFYAVSLDPEIYGVSNFYVIPVGSREMTQNEYLQLAEYSGLSAKEIVDPQNSWIALQAEPAASNRPMSTKERFWRYFQIYEVFRGREETTIQQDVPVTIYVGCGENLGTYTIYPKNDMSAYSLQTEVMRLYRYASEEQQALWWPTEEELGWEEAVAMAKDAMTEHTLRSEEPVKDYVIYGGHSMMGDTTQRVGTWVIALYYSDGGSYLVNLDSTSGEINAISRYPDGTYDFDRQWEVDEAMPQSHIVYSK